MWERLNKLIKPNGAIVLFGSEPFSSYLRMSNISNYKYDWVWNKKKQGNPLTAKIQPLKIHELIHVFSSGGKALYYPEMTKGQMRKKGNKGIKSDTFGTLTNGSITTNDLYYPKSIIEVSNANRKGKVHPTQKPVKLLEYLIRTYTIEGETVLDFTMGSGTTGYAAKRLRRKFYGIELDPIYFAGAKKRINSDIQEDLF